MDVPLALITAGICLGLATTWFAVMSVVRANADKIVVAIQSR